MLIQGPIKLIQDHRELGTDREKSTMTPAELVSAMDELMANPKEPAGDIKGPSEEPTDHTEEPQKLIHVVPISDLRGHECRHEKARHQAGQCGRKATFPSVKSSTCCWKP